MPYTEPHKVQIENEDLFELKAWLQEMRLERIDCSGDRLARGEYVRSQERRLAIFEKIMRQLP